MRARSDVGETLIEIVVTIVYIGLTATALLYGLGTASNASTAQRNSVRADLIMRNYAEQAKLAVGQCSVGQSYDVTPQQSAGFQVTVTPADLTDFDLPVRTPVNGVVTLPCPAVATAQLLTIKVTVPRSLLPTTMQIRVRTP